MEQRKPAVPIRISELLSGTYSEQEDGPGTVIVDGTQIERARIYGIAVSTGELVVDDGTGSILVRSFDATYPISVGDAILVIGKPRMYKNEFYLLGEIVKKVDAKWIDVHKKRMPAKQHDVLSIVRELDSGEGADYNAVLSKIGNNEEKIVHLLAVGELFETKPGKLKVLE